MAAMSSSAPKSFRPTLARIDLKALAHNASLAQRLVGPEVKLLAVVKANAYGHGAIPVSQALVQAGVDFLGVATPEEGLELRGAGIKIPILLLGGAFAASGEELREHFLTPVVYHKTHLSHLTKNLSGELPCHLKVDTGMSRLGIFPQELPDMLKLFQSYPLLKLTGILTHLAKADETFSDGTAAQFLLFEQVEETVKNWASKVPVFHIANSAAILGKKVKAGQWARPGIMLYGANPHPRLEAGRDLKPVMNFETKIVSLKEVAAGTAVSYGGDWVAERPSRIAVLPVGYADGYLRSLSNRGMVLVKGKRAPVVGRVCMDLTMIDVTDIPEVGLGDPVCLWGSGLPVEEVAEWAGTISYELLCGVSKRVPRVYL